MEDLQRWDITIRRKLARATKSKGSSSVKDKPKDKPIPGTRKYMQEITRKEAAAAKRMQELMRQFGTILNQASCSLTLCFSCLDL